MTVLRAADLDLAKEDIDRAAALFGISTWTKLGGFENLLIRAVEPPGRVLRLTHTSRRSRGAVNAEFEFVAHLADRDIPVVAPIRSRAGRLVEDIETSRHDSLVVACMTEAPGRHTQKDDWTDRNIETYGELVGSMHRAAHSFEPSAVRRPSWTDPVFDVFEDAATSDPKSTSGAAKLSRRRVRTGPEQMTC